MMKASYSPQFEKAQAEPQAHLVAHPRQAVKPAMTIDHSPSDQACLLIMEQRKEVICSKIHTVPMVFNCLTTSAKQTGRIGHGPWGRRHNQ